MPSSASANHATDPKTCKNSKPRTLGDELVTPRDTQVGAGEVRFWRVHTAGETETQQQGACTQVYAGGVGGAAGEAWETHTGPLGWAVGGLVDYGSGGAGVGGGGGGGGGKGSVVQGSNRGSWVSALDRTSVPAPMRYAHCVGHVTTALMAVGDVGGRVLLMR